MVPISDEELVHCYTLHDWVFDKKQDGSTHKLVINVSQIVSPPALGLFKHFLIYVSRGFDITLLLDQLLPQWYLINVVNLARRFNCGAMISAIDSHYRTKLASICSLEELIIIFHNKMTMAAAANACTAHNNTAPQVSNPQPIAFVPLVKKQYSLSFWACPNAAHPFKGRHDFIIQ